MDLIRDTGDIAMVAVAIGMVSSLRVALLVVS